jgi:hypothetical protein
MEVYLSTIFQIDDDELMLALFELGFDTMKNINMLKAADITRICSIIRKLGGMVMDMDGNLSVVPNRSSQCSPC